ncbi:MAG: HAD hydrolase-like protein, partial [SAR324 cluster bacterium]|nr:HAD hydrolase-like protein [SAR324 cluster bacterium]
GRQARADIVQKGLIECNHIPGVLDFINDVKKKGLSLFVVSGSDGEELREVFNKRKIDSLFSAIYGSPPTKTENMKKVKSQVGAQTKGIFFGDSRSDLEAAEKFGLDFIFVKGVSEWREGDRLTRIKGFLTIKDFKEEAWTEF